LLALLAHHFLHVSRIRVKSLTLRLLMSYIYIWDISSLRVKHIKWEAFYEYPKKQSGKTIYRTLYVQKYNIILTEVLAGLWKFHFLQGILRIREGNKLMKTEEEMLANNYIKLIHQVTLHVQIHIMPKAQSSFIQVYGT